MYRVQSSQVIKSNTGQSHGIKHQPPIVLVAYSKMFLPCYPTLIVPLFTLQVLQPGLPEKGVESSQVASQVGGNGTSSFDPLLRELGTTKEILARNAREEGEEN